MSRFSELPEYLCHKKVRGFQITEILQVEDAYRDSVLRGAPDYEVKVTQAWMEKHTPHIGGYFVLYEDGYMSFSTAKAFEAGYTLIEK